MPEPLTADRREERIIKYLESLNKGQLGEFRLSRLNRVSNFRKALIQLMDGFIEARAEELAACWLTQFAEERPARKVVEVGRLPLPERKRRTPKWVIDSGQAADNSRVSKGI